MSAGDVKLLKDSMAKVMVGTGAENVKHGRDFYKYFFGNHPELRVYFKGAESFTPDDVEASERFEKNGQSLLLVVHLLVNCYDNIEVFKGVCRELAARHRQFKMDPALWGVFFSVWVGFLESKMALDDATKTAWATLGKAFNAECQQHLKALGLPSA